MASLIDPRTMDTLSVTGRMLGHYPADTIIDVVKVIKRANIKRWNPISVFTEIRISRDLYGVRHSNTSIIDITFSPTEELINFCIFRERVSLTIGDIQRLQLMTPVPG
ncbi:MAG: hypothetical protein WCV69_04445 [Patescibacteria group bacterium]|jgi:hypothetical protein